MKKLAIALAGALFMTAAAPVFACPHSEDKEAPQAPRTAEKDKAPAKAPDTAKTTDKAKAKDTAKKKTDTKAPDKVSLK